MVQTRSRAARLRGVSSKSLKDESSPWDRAQIERRRSHVTRIFSTVRSHANDRIQPLQLLPPAILEPSGAPLTSTCEGHGDESNQDPDRSEPRRRRQLAPWPARSPTPPAPALACTAVDAARAHRGPPRRPPPWPARPWPAPQPWPAARQRRPRLPTLTSPAHPYPFAPTDAADLAIESDGGQGRRPCGTRKGPSSGRRTSRGEGRPPGEGAWRAGRLLTRLAGPQAQRTAHMEVQRIRCPPEESFPVNATCYGGQPAASRYAGAPGPCLCPPPPKSGASSAGGGGGGSTAARQRDEGRGAYPWDKLFHADHHFVTCFLIHTILVYGREAKKLSARP